MNGLAIPSNARGAALLGVAWTCAGLAVAVVVTRFYVRLRIIDNLRVNDWLILLTLVRNILVPTSMDGSGRSHFTELVCVRAWL